MATGSILHNNSGIYRNIEHQPNFNFDKNTMDIGRSNNLINQNIVGAEYIIAWYNSNDPKYNNVYQPILKTLKSDPLLENVLHSLVGIGKSGSNRSS